MKVDPQLTLRWRDYFGREGLRGLSVNHRVLSAEEEERKISVRERQSEHQVELAGHCWLGRWRVRPGAREHGGNVFSLMVSRLECSPPTYILSLRHGSACFPWELKAYTCYLLICVFFFFCLFLWSGLRETSSDLPVCLFSLQLCLVWC